MHGHLGQFRIDQRNKWSALNMIMSIGSGLDDDNNNNFIFELEDAWVGGVVVACDLQGHAQIKKVNQSESGCEFKIGTFSSLALADGHLPTCQFGA